LARTLVGRRIGLALSSGGAHGLAHIGVLNILEQEKIPIDFVGGTSMGSIIGGAYAAGRRGKELYRVGWEAGRMFNLRTGWRSWDLRLSRSGLMKGELFRKAAERWTHGMRFEDLEIELFLVAAEVVSGRGVVFHDGPVADAIRASVSVPLAFTPVPYGNDFLFDGACADPVPCKPLADAGADIIIACNAIPQVEDRLYRKVRKRVGPGRPPGMFEVSQSEREIMSAQVALLKMQPVDVLITPKVGMYSWMEGNRIDTFIQIGEDAARAAVPKIKELLKPGVRRTRRVWV
jgi:NTE family protein